MCLQDLHVISLILLLRIGLTRRGGVCWSEPRGVPRPAYNDGGCASPSLEASQDWHKTLESMLNDENDLEGVNLGQERDNSAWEGVIRPGPGNPGLAQPEQCQNSGPREIIPARPDPPDPAQPGVVKWQARRGAGLEGARGAGPVGVAGSRPSQGRPAGTPAHAGMRRGQGAAQPDKKPRPSWVETLAWKEDPGPAGGCCLGQPGREDASPKVGQPNRQEDAAGQPDKSS
jgi:hypothetical protein